MSRSRRRRNPSRRARLRRRTKRRARNPSDSLGLRCREIRRSGSDVPILMLTARGQESDKVQGLKLGADDYVTKPFGFLELLARVEALLRRAQRPAPPERYAFGEIEVDLLRRTATRAGAPLELSSREFSLLEYLISRRGESVTREQLLQAVWGYQSLPLTRTVDMHVAKLRRKLELDPASPKWLLTIHRVGYKFVG
ncbi:MAG: response regulator transcription factor [Myxococcota bacterium]